MNLDPLFSYLFELLVLAGDYALQVQDRVDSLPVKDYPGNLFGQALTDADVSVQNFIEVALLARFPDLAFFGEEEAQSRNTKYFPKKAKLKVLLDPIDGTRFYADKLKIFNIIVSIIDEDDFVGGIVYHPGIRRFFFAQKAQGAFTLDASDLNSKQAKRSLKLNPQAKFILGSKLHLRQSKLGSHQYLEMHSSYKTGADWKLSVNGILWSEVAGIILKDCNVIDSGVIAFIAKEAGGVVSDLNGQALQTLKQLSSLSYPGLIVGADQAMHQSMLNSL